MWITSLFDDLISLIYPKFVQCNNSLLKHEQCICTFFQFHIPKTNHFKIKENDLQKLFWGKVQLGHDAALYEFVKDSPLQKMIHAHKAALPNGLDTVAALAHGLDRVYPS